MNIADFLTPYSLAIWTMDDGCNSAGSLIYNTHSFSYKNQQKLIEILDIKFGIKARLNKDRKNYRIRIMKCSMNRLIKMIKPFIVPSMMYKIVPVTTEVLKN
ncbi:MAG: hypothetical protein COS42_02935 [Flavobacteriales bacterium CG03_land_8_20_14_0_80_35_15]|nr:MAG: hypothetical protein COS42_02935 [Flavobacteriales bacterium CG03_land_8_20_14_0_80_35_15]